jgi:hypothetical protein
VRGGTDALFGTPKYQMKIRDFITEDAKTDVIYSKIVDKLRIQLYEYLYRSLEADANFQLPIAVYKGEDIPCIIIREVVKGGPFQDTLVMFQYTDGYGLSGKAIAFQTPVHGCNYAVVIAALGETVSKIMNTLSVDRTAAIFRHEFIHVMDFKRYKGRVFDRPGRNGPQYEPNDPEEHKQAERERYYNSAEELNAFFHNLAEPLLNQHRFVNDDPEAAEFFDPLPDNFTDYLAKVTGRLMGETKRFWQHLTPANKRKLTTRLYRLFQDYKNATATTRGGGV